MTLYQGGEYWLYRYKKYTDVRLVFAPEDQAAFFGGDPDNFTYPRYDLDMALFRVYENGKPIETKDYLKWNPKGAGDDELVFVPGHPGSTQRMDTVAQLEFDRDYTEPISLKVLKNRIALLQQYSAQGTEQARQAASMIFGLQNSVKAREGRYAGLLDKSVMSKKEKDEEDFKAKRDGQSRVAESLWRRLGRHRRSHPQGSLAREAAVLPRHRFAAAEFPRPGFGARQHGGKSSDSMWPKSRSRMASACPGYHDAQLESLESALVLAGPHLSVHGDRTHDRRARSRRRGTGA